MIETAETVTTHDESMDAHAFHGATILYKIPIVGRVSGLFCIAEALGIFYLLAEHPDSWALCPCVMVAGVGATVGLVAFVRRHAFG